MAALFAATHPDRVDARSSSTRPSRARTWAPDYDWAWTAEERERAHGASWSRNWGEGLMARRARAEPRRATRDFMRLGRADGARWPPARPRSREIIDLIGETDVRDVLPSIRVPDAGDAPPRRPRSSTSSTRATWPSTSPARGFVELEGSDNLFSIGDDGRAPRRDRGVPHRRAARARARPRARHRAVHRHRRLHRARGRAGRPRWREPARAPRRAGPRASSSATAAGRSSAPATASWPPSTAPRAAIRCAPRSIEDGRRGSGIEVRAGLHTGECEVMGDDVGGLAVHIGARVMGAGGAGRGARLEHGEGPRGRLGNRVRGSRRATS